VLQDCTKGILISELQRGRDIVAKFPLRESSGAAVKLLDFTELAQPVNFLGPGSYANYLQVVAAASSNEDFAKWSGYLNARVKHFVSRLHNAQGMLRARPWPKEFPVPMCTSSPECPVFVMFRAQVFYMFLIRNSRECTYACTDISYGNTVLEYVRTSETILICSRIYISGTR
jgi:poly(A) polymerase Pap1